MEKKFEAELTLRFEGHWKGPPADEAAQQERESFVRWLNGQLSIYYPQLQRMVNRIRERAGDYPDGL